MRALLINPKTPLSFWSFPEQAIFTGRKALCPPLGLLTVAAMLPTDWDLRLVDLDAQNLTEADWNWT
ncbi:MAG: cobalamin-binding protein, partial [Deltaproteobacteria bacterium]|nr:cobalamin-binding protein [Deltaproteobacteria bacterium]